VARFNPGQSVPIQVDRGGQVKRIQVKLGERPLGNPSTSGG
jgi:multidrug efflux pump subunit AcrA (membrane-fusion protein)